MSDGSPPPLDAQREDALNLNARQEYYALIHVSYTGDQPDLRMEDVEQIARLIRELGASRRALLARVDDLTLAWKTAVARVDDLERANERLRTPPTDDDLLVIKSAISLLSHPRYDAEILARDAWECFERLTARVDDLERERDEAHTEWGAMQATATRMRERAEAAESEVARLTAQVRVRMTSPKCSGCGDDICTLDHGRAELLAAEVARLRTALSEIADAGTGIPDWRAMADCARAALSGGAAE